MFTFANTPQSSFAASLTIGSLSEVNIDRKPRQRYWFCQR